MRRARAVGDAGRGRPPGMCRAHSPPDMPSGPGSPPRQEDGFSGHIPCTSINSMPDPIPNSTEHDWEEQARGWVAWARRPDHYSYWRYRDGFFGFVPEPGKATPGRLRALRPAW